MEKKSLEFWATAPVEATQHALKVALFIAVSGGLTALLNNIGQLKLDPYVAMLVSAIINIILAWLKKYQDVKNG